MNETKAHVQYGETREPFDNLRAALDRVAELKAQGQADAVCKFDVTPNAVALLRALQAGRA